MNEDTYRVQRLVDVQDKLVRDAIASAVSEWGIDEEHVAVAEILFGKTGYMEFGDESGATPWQSRSWQSIEVRLGPHLLKGDVIRVEHAARGEFDSWVEATLHPAEQRE